MSEEPGRDLLIHRAPQGLVEAALRRRAERPKRWPALAAAAAVLLSLSGAWALWSGPSPAPEAPPAAPAAAPAAVPVRLSVHAPEAHKVEVAASWNNWEYQTTPMTALPDGTFFTVVTLPPGQYEYMFVLDGNRWLTDPTALLFSDDEFGNRNAVLEI